jgi:ABC-type nickel/cobalt efflux system permease component RcnA
MISRGRRLTLRLGVALAALAALLAGFGPLAVAAHPLGNFSVNRYSRLEVGAERLTVHYVLDMAEIPAFQERQAIDADRDGAVSAAETDAYAARRVAGIRDGLRLTINGAPAHLQATDQALSFPEGQGGLATLRLQITFAAPLPAGDAALDYRDTNEPERQGWREIVARAAAGRTLREASVPTTDISDELRAYPDDMLSSPLNVREARLGASAAPGAAGDAAGVRAGAERARDAFAGLIATETLTPTVLLLSLLVAFGLGAAHALSPGHGKTVVAAYLVGARGTARHAIALGLTVTITHTIGVFALGLVTLVLSQYILPERLYPWLGTLSGLLVVGIGLGLARARLRAALPRRTAATVAAPAPAAVAVPELVGVGAPVGTSVTASVTEQAGAGWHRHDDGSWHSHSHDDSHDHSHGHDYGHSHDHHDHDHGDHHHHHGWFDAGHEHGPHTHTHEMPERVTWRSLLALGVSGGLIPCPSALVVLLSAIALHRVGFGLLLIVAFSAGLAAVLTGIGLLLVYAGRLFARLPTQSRLMRLLPVLSALLVTFVGAAITLQALSEAGVFRL